VSREHKGLVTIHTDGACLGNPGPGGFAAIIEDCSGQRTIARGYHLTTNNRMELMAAIEALRSLPARQKVRLFSDSQYLVNGMKEGWARTWQRNGWRRSSREPALNADLWSELLGLADQHDVEWIWVRGHADDELNVQCDRLAVEYATNHATESDEVFEKLHQAKSSMKRSIGS